MNKENVEDIYPLSPMQQGMLFHTLYNPEAGMYLSQLNCTFAGLNAQAFERAWQRIVERHSIFRTAFIWEGLDNPVQVVLRQIGFRAQRIDWSELPKTRQQEMLACYLEQERSRGLDCCKAPLMRIALIEMGPGLFEFVWTYHHMLMDAWSESLVVLELMSFYRTQVDGVELSVEAPHPYGEYIAWLARQDEAEAERFWRRTLKGVTEPTRVKDIAGGAATTDAGYSEQHITLLAENTAALKSAAKQSRLTLNTIVQGAWALLLSHYGAVRDVVFGVNVSGRPASLPGVESMIGIFINTLPLRVSVDAESRLVPWLRDLQCRQAELREFEYSALARVQTWSDVPSGQPLFESILVFQNAPVPAAAKDSRKRNPDLEVRNVQFKGGWTNYALALDVKPAAEMILNLSYDQTRYHLEFITHILDGLRVLLIAFIQEPECKLEHVLDKLAAMDKQWKARKAMELRTTNVQRLKQVRRRSIRTSDTEEAICDLPKQDLTAAQA